MYILVYHEYYARRSETHSSSILNAKTWAVLYIAYSQLCSDNYVVSEWCKHLDWWAKDKFKQDKVSIEKKRENQNSGHKNFFLSKIFLATPILSYPVTGIVTASCYCLCLSLQSNKQRKFQGDKCVVPCVITAYPLQQSRDNMYAVTDVFSGYILVRVSAEWSRWQTLQSRAELPINIHFALQLQALTQIPNQVDLSSSSLSF